MSDEQGDLGDIDVLVADNQLKKLLVIECKDLALARTSFEMSCELTTLFIGSTQKKSIVETHQRKTRWVCKNLGQILSWLGVDSGGWTVHPLIVVDREMFTPYLKRSPVPIVPLEKLKDDLARK